jgi:hypothetical protein
MSYSKEQFEQIMWTINSSKNDLSDLINRMDARDAAWAQKQLEEQEKQNGK